LIACKADSNIYEIEEDLGHVLRMLREAVLAKPGDFTKKDVHLEEL